jgi:hypothetical protein
MKNLSSCPLIAIFFTKIFVVDLNALLETIVKDVDDKCASFKKPKKLVDVN